MNIKIAEHLADLILHSRVPNSKPNHDSIKLEIYGMEGVPIEDIGTLLVSVSQVIYLRNSIILLDFFFFFWLLLLFACGS
jgi:hypothetical protein